MKKIALTIGTTIAVIAPIGAVISCGISPATDKGYTIGYAMPAISTLNYIKYKSSVDISSSLVQSLFKGGPDKNSAIKNYLKLPNVYLATASGGINLFDYSYQTGTLRRSFNSKNISSNFSSVFLDDYSRATTATFNLNGQSRWANGEKLTSSNFIDSIVYILDINTGSQRVEDTYGLGLKGARNFVNAQNQYAKKFGVAYLNPFGYKEHKLPDQASDELKAVWSYSQQSAAAFPLQLKNNPQERAYVDAIEAAARRLGVFGDKFSSHPKMNSKGIPMALNDDSKFEVSNGKKAKVQPFKLRVESGMPISAFTWIVNGIAMNSKNWMPVNRHYVESIGGVEEFGKDQNHFLSEGPFKIKDAVLGVNGNIMLEKNQDYFAKKEIIPNSVKIFFQQDPIVSGSLFEDGYISSAKIDAVYTKKFFSNPNMRTLIKKSGGYGMTGFIFNLDKETNKNSALLDPHFRKALLFATDRHELIKISGFDSTVPSYSFIEPTTGLNNWIAPITGVSYGDFKSGDKIKYSDSFSAPVMSNSSLESVGINQLFSNPEQTDELHNIKEAKKEMQLFKKDHPEFSNGISLQFLNDSSTVMQNMALALKSELKNAFGGFVDFVIKGLPKSIYDSYVSEGKFDMTWKNLDYLPHDISIAAGIDKLLLSDGINSANLKNIGFNSNPTGSWTFANAFKYYESNKNIESIMQVKSRLGISDQVWDKLKSLAEVPNIPELDISKRQLLQRLKVTAFFNLTIMDQTLLPASLTKQNEWTKVDENFDTTTEMIDIVQMGNKILMDQAVLIPTFRVDITVNVDRLPTVSYTRATLSFDYLYDLLRKPRPDLPGLEVKGV